MALLSLPRIHCDIDTALPLQAGEGSVTLSGWVFIENQIIVSTRIKTVAACLPAIQGINRDDVAVQFPQFSTAPQSGFIIKGDHPSGIYLAQLEIQDSSKQWHTVQEFTLCVHPSAFSAALDSPISHGILHDRVKVGGWALHPDAPLIELSLRYGHRDLPCKIGLERTDVRQSFPNVTHAATAGFESLDFLWAGHGSVRLKGKLSNGRIVTANLPVTFSIDRDENHEPELELTAPRLSLPRSTLHKDSSARPLTDRPLNILYVLHGSFTSNSALHVTALANELCQMGHDCAVAVPQDKDSVHKLSSPLFQSLLHEDIPTDLNFKDAAPPDIVHAWTTRENVRILTERIQQTGDPKVIIHLEDNEQEILSLTLGRPIAELETLPDDHLDQLVPSNLSHPRKSRAFLKQADGITLITDKLKAFAPPGIPTQLLIPSADTRYFYPRDKPAAFRKIFNSRADETIIFYHGNVHSSNAKEVRELYQAVRQLNVEGHPTILIRVGLDTVHFMEDIRKEVAPYVITLGHITHHHHLPPLMALADIFVQPGSPDMFNDFRFPSKLPEFFSIGRPVILPRTNLGTLVSHRKDAYVLEHANAKGITGAVKELISNQDLYETLSKGAVTFAQKHFNWQRSAETLAKFYESLATS